MEIEIYQAFTSAGVPEDKARMAADSIRKEIDDRYREHIETLVTHKDLASAVSGLERSIGIVRTDLEASIGGVRSDLKLDIERLGGRVDVAIADLGTKIAESTNQTIRWTIGTLIAVAAVSFTAAKGLWG